MRTINRQDPYVPYTPSMPKAKRGIRATSHASAAPYAAGASASSTNASAPSSSGPKTSALLDPIKAYGQNFLKNPAIIDAIVQKSGIKQTDTILEIGPGTGNLTVKVRRNERCVGVCPCAIVLMPM